MSRIISTLFAVALLSVPVFAQAPYVYPNPPWCPTCYIEANVDVPAYGSNDTISGAPYGTYVAGWAFQCTTGNFPTTYQVAVTQNGSSTVVAAEVYNGLARPDVWQHFYNAQSHCALPQYSGFHIYFPQGLPMTGAALLTVNLWYGGMLNSQTRNVVIQ